MPKPDGSIEIGRGKSTTVYAFATLPRTNDGDLVRATAYDYDGKELTHRDKIVIDGNLENLEGLYFTNILLLETEDELIRYVKIENLSGGTITDQSAVSADPELDFTCEASYGAHSGPCGFVEDGYVYSVHLDLVGRAFLIRNSIQGDPSVTLLGQIFWDVPGSDRDYDDRYHGSVSLVKTLGGYTAYRVDHNKDRYRVFAQDIEDLPLKTSQQNSEEEHDTTYVQAGSVDDKVYLRSRTIWFSNSGFSLDIESGFQFNRVDQISDRLVEYRVYPKSDQIIELADRHLVVVAGANRPGEDWEGLSGCLFDSKTGRYHVMEGSAFGSESLGTTQNERFSVTEWRDRTDETAQAGWLTTLVGGQRYIPCNVLMGVDQWDDEVKSAHGIGIFVDCAGLSDPGDYTSPGGAVARLCYINGDTRVVTANDSDIFGNDARTNYRMVVKNPYWKPGATKVAVFEVAVGGTTNPESAGDETVPLYYNWNGSNGLSHEIIEIWEVDLSGDPADAAELTAATSKTGEYRVFSPEGLGSIFTIDGDVRMSAVFGSAESDHFTARAGVLHQIGYGIRDTQKISTGLWGDDEALAELRSFDGMILHILVGDSTTRQDKDGYEYGLARAYAHNIGQPMLCSEGESSPSGTGTVGSSLASSTGIIPGPSEDHFSNDNIYDPTGVGKFFAGVPGLREGAIFAEIEGEIIDKTWTVGWQIPGGLLPYRGLPLTVRMFYAAGSTMGSVLNLGARKNVSGYTQFGGEPQVDPSSQIGVQSIEITRDLTSTFKDSPIVFGPAIPSLGSNSLGPMTMLWGEADFPMISKGGTILTWVYQGGESLRQLFESLQNAEDDHNASEYIAAQIRRVRQRAKQRGISVKTVIDIQSIHNDINDSEISVGWLHRAGQSQTGYYDGLGALQDLLTDLLDSAGISTDEIVWLCKPSLRDTEPALEKKSYSDASLVWPGRRTRRITLSCNELIEDADAWLTTARKNGGSDPVHFSLTGFADMGEVMYDELFKAPVVHRLLPEIGTFEFGENSIKITGVTTPEDDYPSLKARSTFPMKDLHVAVNADAWADGSSDGNNFGLFLRDNIYIILDRTATQELTVGLLADGQRDADSEVSVTVTGGDDGARLYVSLEGHRLRVWWDASVQVDNQWPTATPDIYLHVREDLGSEAMNSGHFGIIGFGTTQTLPITLTNLLLDRHRSGSMLLSNMATAIVSYSSISNVGSFCIMFEGVIARWMASAPSIDNERRMILGLNGAFLICEQSQGDEFVTVKIQTGGVTRTLEFPTVDLFEWHHYAVRYTGSEMIAYLDGYEVDRIDATGSTASATTALIVGNTDEPSVRWAIRRLGIRRNNPLTEQDVLDHFRGAAEPVFTNSWDFSGHSVLTDIVDGQFGLEDLVGSSDFTEPSVSDHPYWIPLTAALPTRKTRTRSRNGNP